MSVLSSETSVLATGARLPRVNLLPPEIAEGQKLRKLQLALGATGVAAVAVVGLLYLSASHSVSSAQTSLTTAQSQTTNLNTQIAKYNNVTATEAAMQAAQAQLTRAMADEVRYSFLLKDLSLSMPSTVWFKNVSFAAAAPIGGAAVTGTPAVAKLTVSGVAFSHDDVALWLESLAGQQNAKGQKTYANPYFTNSTEALVGNRPTVNFSSSADLTVTALSGRYLTSGS